MNLKKFTGLSALVLGLTFGFTLLGGDKTRAAGPVCSVPGDYATIQGAVNDPGCITINVAPGPYVETVTIGRSLTLNGAQAGNPVAGRVFGSPAESTLTGRITIQAAGVIVDGFSQTNPNQAFGIVVKTSGDSAVITNNIINNIGSASFATNPAAIYLETGPDAVSVIGNRISNVQSIPTAQGILVGDSTSSNPSLNILIEGNTIEDITSVNRGAYGIQANNGASTAPTATGFTTVTIRDNVLDDLTGGGWAHAIGLEGDTPAVIVDGNTISDVVDLTPSPVNDAIAVFFEANAFFGNAEVHNNNFNVGSAAFGVAVHPALSAAFPNALVDAECNWWGAPNGPGPVGSGAGAMVSPSVDYSPWLVAPAPFGSCGGQEATNKDQCKDGGWMNLFRANGTTFKNQGDCIQYVNTGK